MCKIGDVQLSINRNNLALCHLTLHECTVIEKKIVDPSTIESTMSHLLVNQSSEFLLMLNVLYMSFHVRQYLFIVLHFIIIK